MLSVECGMMDGCGSAAGRECCRGLLETQFDTRLLGHHALVPYGLEHEVHVGRMHIVERIYLLAHVLKYEVGSRT